MQCKIADLGFARKLADEQLAETNCGTPLIMAPECLRGDFYDHRADVWSLGCLYYEMLTGFTPFTGTSLQNLQENIARGTYQIPKTIKLSTTGLDFLDKCLKYNPDERFGWQQLADHGYIQHTEYEMLADIPDPKRDSFLYLSTIEMKHEEVLKDPYKWLRNNKDLTYVLNVRNEEQFN
jgi:serine/threonine protein kinase